MLGICLVLAGLFVTHITFFEGGLGKFIDKYTLGLELLFSLNTSHGVSIYFEKLVEYGKLVLNVKIVLFSLIVIVFYLFGKRQSLNCF